jgi:segregation and condensation protein A
MQELAPPPLPVLAIVAGRSVTELPTDLFIPPDALEVLLDSFTGPLDLLLYLIRQQNIDILDIPMAKITQQYMQYIELLEERRMELAADYLVMAALLVEIKSKLLLPVSVSLSDQIEEDPRMQLVRRLQAYEFFKQTALFIDQLPRYERDVFQVQVSINNIQLTVPQPDITLSALMSVMENLLSRQQCLTHHQIAREPLSVRERMTFILQRLQVEKLVEFTQLLNMDEGRMGLVVTLLAILELAKQSLVVVTQTEHFSPIHIQAS